MLKRLRSHFLSLVLAILFAGFITLTACNSKNTAPAEKFQINHPEWSNNATIYELNVRQYTPSGTFTEL